MITTQSPASKVEAQALNSKFFWAPEPCKNGHVSPRNTSDGSCVECRRVASREWNARNKNRVAEAGSRWQRANQDKCNAKSQLWKTKIKEQEPFRFLIYRIRKRCEERNIKFGLTAEYLQTLYDRNPICPIMQVRMRLAGERRTRWDQVSVDRIDPQSGYVAGNVALLSYRANSIKSDLTDPAIFRRMADWLEEQQERP